MFSYFPLISFPLFLWMFLTLLPTIMARRALKRGKVLPYKIWFVIAFFLWFLAMVRFLEIMYFYPHWGRDRWGAKTQLFSSFGLVLFLATFIVVMVTNHFAHGCLHKKEKSLNTYDLWIISIVLVFISSLMAKV